MHRTAPRIKRQQIQPVVRAGRAKLVNVSLARPATMRSIRSNYRSRLTMLDRTNCEEIVLLLEHVVDKQSPALPRRFRPDRRMAFKNASA